MTGVSGGFSKDDYVVNFTIDELPPDDMCANLLGRHTHVIYMFIGGVSTHKFFVPNSMVEKGVSEVSQFLMRKFLEIIEEYEQGDSAKNSRIRIH